MMNFKWPLSQYHEVHVCRHSRSLPCVQVVAGLCLMILVSMNNVAEAFTVAPSLFGNGGSGATMRRQSEAGVKYVNHLTRTTSSVMSTRLFSAGGDDSSTEPASTSTNSAQTTEKALLGMGCFWAPQEQFTKIPGVLKATSGYAVAYYKDSDDSNSETEEGNQEDDSLAPSSVPAASYFSVCNGDGRTEAVLVEFDPSVTSYQKMLSYFWQGHNAAAQQLSPDKAIQYASVIWPLSDEQQRIAVEDLEKATAVYQEAKIGTPKTIISENVLRQGDFMTTTLFTPAETIHQNFWTKLSVKIGVIFVVSALSSYHIIPEYIASYGLQAIVLWIFWESVELAATALGSLGLAKPTSTQNQQITTSAAATSAQATASSSSTPKL